MKRRWIECCHFLFIATHWFYLSWGKIELQTNRFCRMPLLMPFVSLFLFGFCGCCYSFVVLGGGDYDQEQNVPRMTKWLERALHLIFHLATWIRGQTELKFLEKSFSNRALWLSDYALCTLSLSISFALLFTYHNQFIRLLAHFPCFQSLCHHKMVVRSRSLL